MMRIFQLLLIFRHVITGFSFLFNRLLCMSVFPIVAVTYLLRGWVFNFRGGILWGFKSTFLYLASMSSMRLFNTLRTKRTALCNYAFILFFLYFFCLCVIPRLATVPTAFSSVTFIHRGWPDENMALISHRAKELNSLPQSIRKQSGLSNAASKATYVTYCSAGFQW